ncbi:MAG: hypothetical protein IH945_08240 [Armatimonadetes bacterium]|nr:hypothetical protein [Armatimonadota bacterium]
MRAWWIAPLALLSGCASNKGAPIAEHASWVFDETEFEAYYFDVFEDYPDRTLSTEEIGQHPVGTNILLQKQISADEAKNILRLLEESEKRPFWTEPVDLSYADLAVLRFERAGEIVDIGIDPDAEYVTVYINGEMAGSEIYRTDATELTAALSPFLDLEYFSGELEMRLDSERAGTGYRLTVKVKNGTKDTLLIPPVKEAHMFIEFRNADGEMVYRQPIYDPAQLEPDEFVTLKSGYSEFDWIDISPDRLTGEPTEVRAFFSAYYDGENKFELYSDWVTVD